LTDYGLIALKRRRDLQREEVLSPKKIKLLHLMLAKEKEEEKEDSKIKTEKEAPVHLLERIKEKTFLKSNVSNVYPVSLRRLAITNKDTSLACRFQL